MSRAWRVSRRRRCSRHLGVHEPDRAPAVLGSRGSEELSKRPQRYFDRLIEGIAAHGGTWWKMAGDALIALWPVSEREDVASATLACNRAASLSRRHSRITRWPKESAQFQGRDRAGEVSDAVRWRRKGSVGIPPGRLPSGPDGPGRAPGQLWRRVLSKEAWALIRGGSTGEPLERGFVPAPPDSERSCPGRLGDHSTRLGAEPWSEDLSPAAIPRPDRRRADRWSRSSGGSSVLFINLPPTDLDTPESAGAGSIVIRTVQAASVLPGREPEQAER